MDSKIKLLTFKINNNMANRIWTEGEGMTWSTITDLLGDGEEAAANLRLLTLDLVDHLDQLKEQMDRAQERVRELESRISFATGNLSMCTVVAQKRLGYTAPLVYLHDRASTVVKVTREVYDSVPCAHVEKIEFIDFSTIKTNEQ